MGILLTTSSCLVTEGLEPREVVTEVNSWPRIVEESVTPPNWTPIVPAVTDDCQEVELTLGKLADDNLEDDLYVRLFVDYDPNGGPNKVYRDSAHIVPNGQLERVGPTFHFEPKDFCRGYHVVRALVADGPFSQDSKEFDVVEGADRGVTSYSWTINTSGCSGAGACSP